MKCPECQYDCIFIINGWWCQDCGWNDIYPNPDNYRPISPPGERVTNEEIWGGEK